jgi:hypothetical protein
MRTIVATLFLLSTACGSSSTPAGPLPADGGTDSRTYEAGDFSSFRYSFYGTGISGSFEIDRDCGIATKGPMLAFRGPSVPTGNGVIGDADCQAFKDLAVSDGVLTALAGSKTDAGCELVTDDYVTTSLSLSDGQSFATPTLSGCSEVEPFKKLRNEGGRLANKYVTASDAGTD